MRLRWLVDLVAAAGLTAGCASRSPTEQMAIWREAAVSQRTWERVEPYLEALGPGDDFELFAGARKIYVQGRGRAARPVVVIPSWISSLSGGAAGGLSMFGQLQGRDGDRIRGSHVFGTVTDGRIHPRYQVFTEATVVDRETFDSLRRRGQHTPGLGQLPRPDGPLFFRDLLIVARRPLDFPDPLARLPEGGAAAFYSQAEFRAIEPILDAVPPGTDLMSLLALLGATFVTDDFGESHGVLVPGFLQTRDVRTQTAHRPDGIFKMRPFGWISNDREVVDRIAIFQNDRLVEIVRHRGLADWSGYLD